MAVYEFNGVRFEYELFVPACAQTLLPLVVCLKADETDGIAAHFTGEKTQAEHPSFVLVPDVRDWTKREAAQALQRLIFSIRRQYRMDICRTYLAGQGAGAADVWHMLGSYPRLFAGAVAVGGCGDPYHARNAKFTPVWAFHAADDEIAVSGASTLRGTRFLAGSRRLIAALRTDGAQLARYTEYATGANALAQQVFESAEVMDWLHRQDRKKVLRVEMIRPGVYRLDDWFMSSCYLITGTERALLVDTTMAHADLMDTVRGLTSLPVSVAVTHPHLDHMLHAYAFDTVYLHERDAAQLDAHLASMARMLRGDTGMDILTDMVPDFLDRALHVQGVVPMKDGDVIDLGGGVQVEMMELGGHMQNHVVFADHGHRCVFTGDAVGSGYVVGVNYPKDRFLETYRWYRENLDRFIARMAPLGEYTYFGGHFIQENSCDDPMQEDYLNGQSTFFVPLSFEVVCDMRTLCDELIAGVHEDKIGPDGAFFATHGSASLAGRPL